MSIRSYLREFEDSIYDLVETGSWEKVEEKMDQDDAFTGLLLAYVEARLAEEAGWSARIHISKKTHPVKKERLLAEDAARQTHLAAIETRQQAGYAVTDAFLGETGIQEAIKRRQELAEVWTQSVQSGLV